LGCHDGASENGGAGSWNQKVAGLGDDSVLSLGLAGMLAVANIVVALVLAETFLDRFPMNGHRFHQ